MKTLDLKQGSHEWLEARMGIVTASDVDKLVTPAWKVREWSTEMPNTYLAQKLAEKWRGEPDPGFTSFAMENGSIREKQAIPWFEGIYDVEVRRIGLILSDDGKCGASPDGMFADGSGLEVKVPEAPTHCKYLIGGELPKDYAPQVQFSMFVTGAEHWKFLSWRPDFPKLVLTVPRDEKAMKAFAEALAAFTERFDAGWSTLVNLNGGEPVRKKIDTRIGSDGSVTKTVAGNPVIEWFEHGDKR